MNVYVLYCHPDPESFTAAVRDQVVATLERRGHQVRVADLYADGFDPALSAIERATHKNPDVPRPSIEPYARQLRWCDALVMVHPTWWSGQPAMLTGWFDRVLVAGVAWHLPPGADRIRGLLGNVRRLAVVTTHGSPRWVNVLEGHAGRRVAGRAVRSLCHPLVRVTWLPMYGIDRSDGGDRQAFLAHVDRRLSRW